MLNHIRVSLLFKQCTLRSHTCTIYRYGSIATRIRNKTLYHRSKYFSSTVTVPENKPVFNTSIHNLNKKRASLLSNSHEYDYIRSEIATRLISRILDLDNKYPKTLDLGSHCCPFYKELINFIRQNPTDKVPGGIEEVYEIETCKELLHRDQIPDWQQQLIQSNKVHIDNINNTALPFDDNTFDMIVTGMSLQWINNIPFVFSELARVIKPDGCFIGAFTAGGTLQELRSALLLADQERKGGMNSHMSPSINHQDIGSLLNRAGFVMITVDNEIIEIPYPNMFVLCEHLHGMGDQHAPHLPNTDFRYNGISKDVFIASAAIYDAMYSDSETIQKEKREDLQEYVQKNVEGNDEDMGNISIDATVQILYFMAWSPDPSQSKPAERGSADVSFKDLDEISDIIEDNEQRKNEDRNDDKK